MPQQFWGFNTTIPPPLPSLHISDVFQNPKHITGTVSHLTYSKACAQALSAEAAGAHEEGSALKEGEGDFSFQRVMGDLQPYSWDWHSGLSFSSARRAIREHLFKQSCLCYLKAVPLLHQTGNAISQRCRSKPTPFPHYCPKQKLWSQQSFQRGQ